MNNNLIAFIKIVVAIYLFLNKFKSKIIIIKKFKFKTISL